GLGSTGTGQDCPRAGSSLPPSSAAPWRPRGTHRALRAELRRAQPPTARRGAGTWTPGRLLRTALLLPASPVPAACASPAPPLHSPFPTPRCQCSASVDSPWSGLTSPLRALCSPSRSSPGFWRPWVEAQGKKEEQTPNDAAEAMSNGPGMIAGSGKLSQFRHPVRLFWPKSKCYDYLYQEAEALLKNFPIQATISFYEDSDSEDEIAELTYEN
uniref:Ripply transcriptional repressor 2 n=1 Tax=Callithrix jacchus TaxID=9483 RepID=A0A2R8MHP4_CALJA